LKTIKRLPENLALPALGNQVEKQSDYRFTDASSGMRGRNVISNTFPILPRAVDLT
jgi:hypothetical protein